jgi:hypothetical protein
MFQTFSLSSAGEKVVLENGKAFAPPCAVAEGVRVRRRRGETSFVPVTPAHRSLSTASALWAVRETKLLPLLLPFIVFISIESATAIRPRRCDLNFTRLHCEEFLISTGSSPLFWAHTYTHATYIGQWQLGRHRCLSMLHFSLLCAGSLLTENCYANNHVVSHPGRLVARRTTFHCSLSSTPPPNWLQIAFQLIGDLNFGKLHECAILALSAISALSDLRAAKSASWLRWRVHYWNCTLDGTKFSSCHTQNSWELIVIRKKPAVIFGEWKL